MSNRSSNQQIAKNSLMLYFRMAITMLVQLYTSRVILMALGLSDYGLYNVIGGIVVMFGFINGALLGTTQRYITYELGRDDFFKQRAVFSSALQLHTIIAIIVAVISEPIGLWLIYHEMQIPADRLFSAFVVFQLSVASFVVSVLSVPYDAAIIAHERMSVYAYVSIFDVIIRLIICYVLLLFDKNRLLIYAILVFFVNIGFRFFYGSYCNHCFKETKYCHVIDKRLLKDMVSFSGWNLFGNLAMVLNSQGVNILLNIFFGPIVNAARGIAVQVQLAINGFCSNFQTAVSPELTKSYAAEEFNRTISLMKRTSKFSFYLLFIITLPFLLEIEPVLSLWLKEVPPDSPLFIRLLLIMQLIWTLTSPMTTVIYASGDIKKVNIVCGTITLTLLPICWVVLSFGGQAYMVFVIHIIIEVVSAIFRLLIISNKVNFSVKEFVVDVCLRVSLVGVVSFVVVGTFYQLVSDNLLSVLFIFILSLVVVPLISLYIGMTKDERSFIFDLVLSYCKKIRFCR